MTTVASRGSTVLQLQQKKNPLNFLLVYFLKYLNFVIGRCGYAGEA